MSDQWKESISVPVHKKGNKTDCNNYRGISLLSSSYKILSNIFLSQMKLLVITSVGFDITDKLLIRFSVFVRHWRKNGSTMRQYISFLFLWGASCCVTYTYTSQIYTRDHN
jgi:hypothetical protein